MSGHSKWSTIKHKKGAADAKRGRLFTKLIKEITMSAKVGGGVVDSNPRLRSAVLAAKKASMPSDNIDKAIKRGTGELEGVTYEEITYEGYGPGGAAILIEAMTDNKNRTTAEVRHLLSKYGGNLGATGSVAFQFSKKGYIAVEKGAASEDALMEAALEADADDVVTNDDGSIEVMTDPYQFGEVKEALEKAGFTAEFGEVTMKPLNDTELAGDDALRMQKLLDAIESLDDVQAVYSSAAMDEE